MTSTSPSFVRLPKPADDHVAHCSLVSDLVFEARTILDLIFSN
jgi:hypothetical protein